MGYSPKDVEQRIETIVDAWTRLRKGKSFNGMSLDDFVAKTQPSLDHRQSLVANRAEQSTLINSRSDADTTTQTAIEMLVGGIVSDPAEGPDSEFLDAIGRKRKSNRKSGLTRKKNGNGNGNGQAHA